jgi:hypothetical protein
MSPDAIKATLKGLNDRPDDAVIADGSDAAWGTFGLMCAEPPRLPPNKRKPRRALASRPRLRRNSSTMHA